MAEVTRSGGGERAVGGPSNLHPVLPMESKGYRIQHTGYRSLKDTGYSIQDTGLEGCKCKDTGLKD